MSATSPAAGPRQRLAEALRWTALRTLPPPAYLSLLVIWFGIDESPKVWLLLIAALPPVAAATAAAVRGVPGDLPRDAATDPAALRGTPEFARLRGELSRTLREAAASG